MSTIDLRPCRTNPALLDTMVIDNGHGMPMAMFGLGVELYVSPRPGAELRKDMVLVQEDYYKRFGAHLDRCRIYTSKSPDGKIIKIEGNPFPDIWDGLVGWPEDRGSYCNVLFKKYKNPKYPNRNDGITPWESDILVAPENDKHDRASFLSCYIPVQADDFLNFESLIGRVLHWCEISKPAHGAAGYCVVLEVGSEIGEKYSYATLQRYPGLNIHSSVSFVSQSGGVHNRIKSVNWLTVLGDRALNELGGLETARAALEPDCTLHVYSGGVVIQAGDEPQLGDTYDGDIPDVYRKVARFTRPVRFESYRGSLFRVFDPLIGKEEAVRWVRRFD